MTKVVEQSYWKLVEGQRERFDAACKELVAIGKSEFNCDVTYGAVQTGPQAGNFLFIFTYPDGASYGKYIDTYRTNSAWQEFMKKYSNPPIDEMVSDTERIHML
jgi:quinol monooxygenase YgiN